jgi:hypothetical protein
MKPTDSSIFKGLIMQCPQDTPHPGAKKEKKIMTLNNHIENAEEKISPFQMVMLYIAS